MNFFNNNNIAITTLTPNIIYTFVMILFCGAFGASGVSGSLGVSGPSVGLAPSVTIVVCLFSLT